MRQLVRWLGTLSVRIEATCLLNDERLLIASRRNVAVQADCAGSASHEMSIRACCSKGFLI